MRLATAICLFHLAFVLSSENIESSFREFLDLVPKNRIAIIASRHFLFDSRFRTAVSYLRSTDFEILVRDHVSQSPEVQNVIDYLGREVDLNMIPINIRKLLNRLRPEQEYGSVRGSLSFVQEITDLLPDGQIASLIQTKSSADPQFAEFISKVRNQHFKDLVYRARDSESMAAAIEDLKNSQIEVDPILDVIFKKFDVWFQ